MTMNNEIRTKMSPLARAWQNKGRSALLVAGGLLIASSASAQGSDYGDDYEAFGPNAGDWEFTLSGSGGNDEDFNKGSFGAALSVGHFFSDGLEVGARHNMSFFDSEQSDATFAATTRAFVDYHLDLGRIQPFLGVNLGVRYGNGDVDETGTAAPEVGVKFFALENTFLIGMMEYQFFFEDVNDADDNASDGEFVYTVGIGFTF